MNRAEARDAWAIEETRRLAALGDRVALAELARIEARERGEPAPTPPVPASSLAGGAVEAGRARLARAGDALVRLGLDPKLRPELRELAATMAALVRRIELVESGEADQAVAGEAEAEAVAEGRAAGAPTARQARGAPGRQSCVHVIGREEAPAAAFQVLGLLGPRPSGPPAGAEPLKRRPPDAGSRRGGRSSQIAHFPG
ncbi:hypothetical protein OJF2_79310 (plasmid) [Aquisphaera giovannonii]|uniref:Uncharacterized protein n=1 Tax=Aquisphaera giovannonii TaxID=406548 RepID=A0A5B9WFA8_9BACT|nr:hypothetical protein [Aquisphaera giovannonii]QEH39316.1 hypothetical protein OJF2_79310 [Aquisphaera giovannonii]